MDSSRDIVRKLREGRLLNERKDYEGMSTEELIKLAKEEDQFAFQVLLSKHEDFLWRMTRKYVPEGTFDRDDIMQIAEIAFWEAVKKWDMTGDFEAYAGMVIKRRMADELRKLDTDKAVANRNTVSTNSMEDVDDFDVQGPEATKSEFDSWISNSSRSAEDEYFDSEFKDEMRKFFTDEMTEIERKLIRMYLDGYKMSHIAEVTGLKYKACENAVRRAKNKLKDYFSNMRESRKIREGKDSIFSEEESRFLKDILDDIDGVNESKKMNESKWNYHGVISDNSRIVNKEVDITVDASSKEEAIKKLYSKFEDYAVSNKITLMYAGGIKFDKNSVKEVSESKKMNESVGTWSDPESVGGERAIYYEVEGDDLGSVYSFDNDGDWGYTAYVYKDKEGNRIKKVSKSFRGNGSKESAKKWVEDTINESKKINEMKQEFRVEIYEPGSDECIKIKHFSDKKSADKYADQVNADGDYIATVEYLFRDKRKVDESIWDDDDKEVGEQSYATQVRKVLMDLDIDYYNIAENDDVVYVDGNTIYDRATLKKVHDALPYAESSGLQNRLHTMWFAF